MYVSSKMRNVDILKPPYFRTKTNEIGMIGRIIDLWYKLGSGKKIHTVMKPWLNTEINNTQST